MTVNLITPSVEEVFRPELKTKPTVQITTKDPRFQIIQRQKSFKAATNSANNILKKAIALLKTSWEIGDPIRMLTVTASNLLPTESEFEQLSFF